jgi:hypothetical protein
MHDKSPLPILPSAFTTAEDMAPDAHGVLALIDGWTDLTEDQRRRFKSDLRIIVKMTGLPASCVLLIPVFLRAHVLTHAAARYGCSKSRMCNLRSSLHYILRRLGLMLPKELELLPEWVAVLDPMGEHERRAHRRGQAAVLAQRHAGAGAHHGRGHPYPSH